MTTNVRHKLAAVEAVIESARITSGSRTVFVDDGDVAEALEVIRKHSSSNYPNVNAFTPNTEGRSRVGLKFK
jgi:hypothetical protein